VIPFELQPRFPFHPERYGTRDVVLDLGRGARCLGMASLRRGIRSTGVTLRCLGSREYATLAAAANATFPRAERSRCRAQKPESRRTPTASSAPSSRRPGSFMRLLFVLIEHATVLFPAPGRGGRRRFSSLDREQQVAALDGWRRSRLFPRRLVFTSLRAILTMGYFADPAVLRHLGLAPREIARRPIAADRLWPRIGELPAAPCVASDDVAEVPPLPPSA
jgi:hypothetical protein